MKNGTAQLTIRNLPRQLNTALRQKAVRDGMSMNAAAIEAMKKGLGLTDEPVRYHDLDFLAGTLIKDAAFNRALAEQRKIDPEMWK